MVPAWAAVVIALGASAIGALAAIFGAFMTYRTSRVTLQHEAAEAWRTRQLAAAEDFSVIWTEVLSCVGAVRGALKDRADLAPPLAVVNQKHAEAGARLMRVGLLFGADSQARDAARSALSATNHASYALEKLRDRPPHEIDEEERQSAFDGCNEHIKAAQAAHREFVRVAHTQLRIERPVPTTRSPRFMRRRESVPPGILE
jgi:hypothetical protein